MPLARSCQGALAIQRLCPGRPRLTCSRTVVLQTLPRLSACHCLCQWRATLRSPPCCIPARAGASHHQ
eukprot:5721913-Lingulodinium_polyedra.AAC.1